jgi:hypothetical protein
MAEESAPIVLQFREPQTYFAPKDSAGGLADLALAIPADDPIEVVSGFVGPARRWDTADDPNGFQAVDDPDGDTLLTRDATIEALVTIADVLGAARGFPRCLYARGLGGAGAEEYVSLGLELELVADPPGHLELRMFWMDPDGNLKTQVGGVFVPPPTGYLYIAATRRWDASDSVACRYFVNAQQIAEVISADGAIAGDTTATTTIGIAGDGAGGFEHAWGGDVNQLKVSNYEKPASELEATFARIVRYSELGVALLASKMPRGSNWAAPGTYWHKLTRIAGGVFGYALGKLEELRDNFLPARTYAPELARWERLNSISPRPRESLDRRRARVEGVMGRVNGESIELVQQVMAEPMATTPAGVTVLEFTNRIEEGFGAALSAERWWLQPDAANWTAAAGVLEATADLGDDWSWTASVKNAHYAQISLSSGDGKLIHQAKLVDVDITDNGSMWALALYNFRNHNLLLVGIEKVGGTLKLGYRSFIDGAAGAFVALEDPAPATPIWIRIRRDPDLPDTYELGWSTVSAIAGFDTLDVAGLIPDPEWAGFWFRSDGVITADSEAHFDDLVVLTPEGDRPWFWYAVAEGPFDFSIANAVAQRLTPAHAHGAAIQSTSVLYDDPLDGLYDHGPMGGL